MNTLSAWAVFTPRFSPHKSFCASTPLPPRRNGPTQFSTPRFLACEAPPSTVVDTEESISAPDYAPAFPSSPLTESSTSTTRRRKRHVADKSKGKATTHVPGPEPLPLVGNALDIVGCSLSELMLRYARQHGSFLKFSIVNDVLYLASDPEAIFHITTSNSRNYLDRWTPPGFEVLLYDGKLRGLVFSQGRYWMQHRQVVGSVFRSSDFLHHYVSTTVEKAKFMVEKLWPTRIGGVVNVHQEMRMLTLDIIGAAAFGCEFGAMTSPTGSHEIETCLSNILHGVLDVIKAPVPLWRFMRTPGRAAIDDDLKRLQEIERGLILERRKRLLLEGETDVSKKDLLGLLLKAHAERGLYFTDDDLMWDVHDVIFAGHETTASALASSLFLVAGSPRVQRQIQNELAEVLPNGEAPTFRDISKLTYLEMVINEALRLYPPTALIGRRAKSEDVIAGYHVPAGSNVLVSPYVMGRLESLWDNPEEFRPERFSPEQTALRHQMTHLPFGAGPRICLGARMATMEAKVILAMIFQRYGFKKTQEELKVVYDSTVSFVSGMDMVLQDAS